MSHATDELRFAAGILREKAAVYREHPRYPWLLPEDEPDKIGNLIGFELEATALALEFIAARKENDDDDLDR